MDFVRDLARPGGPTESGTRLEVENQVYQTRTRPRTWRIEINAEGQRGAPPPGVEKASPLVIALGDSCTFGFRVSEGETYPAQLQSELREHGMPRAAVLNYGVPGYTSFQGRRLLTDVLSRSRPAACSRAGSPR